MQASEPSLVATEGKAPHWVLKEEGGRGLGHGNKRRAEGTPVKQFAKAVKQNINDLNKDTSAEGLEVKRTLDVV